MRGRKGERPGFNPRLGRFQVRRNGKLYYRYRLVMEEHLGRPLRPGEQVHHINGDPTDDRIENLQLMTVQEHSRLHVDRLHEQNRADWKYEWSRNYERCTECGTTETPHGAYGQCDRCYWKARYYRQKAEREAAEFAKVAKAA